MEKEQALEQINIIRHYIENATERFCFSPWQWIEWGIFTIVAIGATDWLLVANLPQYIIHVWILFFVLGGTIETFIWGAEAKTQGISPFASYTMKIWGVLFGLFLFGFAFSIVFIHIGYPLYIVGLWLGIMGIISLILVLLGERRELIWYSLVQIIGAIAAISFLYDYALWVGMVVFGFGSLVIGFYQLLLRNTQKNNWRHK